MSMKLPRATPGTNRLRATAALIPIIESGLVASKISTERAAIMASFCEWTVENPVGDPDSIKLAEAIGDGLKRIKNSIDSGAYQAKLTS